MGSWRGQGLPERWRQPSWHRGCGALARDLPETALRVTSPRLATQPSTAPLSCADVWGREVLHGVVNPPRIDGKDGVAGSIPAGGSTQPVTSGNAGEPRSGPLQPTTSVLEWDAKGQRTVRALNGLLTSSLGRGVSGMARFWAGRIAVTEHIPGPRPRSVVPALVAGGRVLPIRAGFWWPTQRTVESRR